MTERLTLSHFQESCGQQEECDLIGPRLLELEGVWDSSSTSCLFTDEAVETQLGEMPWQVNGCGAQVFSPLSVVVFSLFHNSQCQAFQVRLQLKPLTFLSSSCVPLPLGYWDT